MKIPEKTRLVYEGEPCRLDLFLTQTGENYSRSYARHLIAGGLVTVNGVEKKPAFLLNPGDKVEFAPPVSGELQAGFEDMVIFEDKAMMAINKPAGLSCHPNSANWEVNPQAALLGEPTLVSMIFSARPGMAQLGLERLGLVHRLDRDTSGLMLLAKTPEAQEALTTGFRERVMEKTYLGAVTGVPKAKKGVIDAPIGRASGFKKIKVWEYGREARTEYTVKEAGKKCALLMIHPTTGRTNQIRIHLAHIGHPIIGDKLYGGPDAGRMLLHAYSLVFAHPLTGKKTKFLSPMPKDFKDVWNAEKEKREQDKGRKAVKRSCPPSGR